MAYGIADSLEIWDTRSAALSSHMETEIVVLHLVYYWDSEIWFDDESR